MKNVAPPISKIKTTGIPASPNGISVNIKLYQANANGIKASLIRSSIPTVPSCEKKLHEQVKSEVNKTIRIFLIFILFVFRNMRSEQNEN